MPVELDKLSPIESDLGFTLSNGRDDNIVAGKAFRRTIAFKESDGTAVDMTGYTINGKVFNVDTTELEAFSFSPSTLDSTGETEISLTAAETTAACGVHAYELNINNGTSDFMFQFGKFRVRDIREL